MELIATTDVNVSFEGQVTKYGRQITKKITISYKGNEFSENSLWLQTLKSAKNSNYLNVLNFGVIASIFPTLLASEMILKILQEPVASLTTERITLFFKLIDDEIDKRPINEKSKYRYSFQIKKFFSRLDLKIVGGGSIEGCYRASKPSFYAGKNRPVLDVVNDKASRTAFTDLNELNALVKSQYHEKIETLQSACKSDIEQHLSIVENFIRLKGVPLPDHIENKIRSNVEIDGTVRTKFPPDPFHVSARIVEICAINDFSHYKYFKEQGRKFCRSSGSKECRFYVTTVEKKIIPRVEVWLCDLFLPRRILLACLISLQLATGANVSTLLTLTKSRIEKISANKYVIVGIKTKTNKEIKLEVNKRDNSLAYQAIELLLRHDSNISKYWKRNSSSVFCSLSTRGEEIFDIFNFDKMKDRWIAWHGIDHFAFDDLRDLIAQYDYLSHKDPFRVQALLQHANVAVTDHYIENNVIAILRTANINEFMRRLAPSIAFNVDKDAAASKSFDFSKIDNNLLFPVSKFDGATNAISDQWLMSEGGIEFTVDVGTIAHCAYQRSYYLRYFDSLISANKEKFYKYHLPRIIFCMALYKLIEVSEYNYLLSEVC